MVAGGTGEVVATAVGLGTRSVAVSGGGATGGDAAKGRGIARKRWTLTGAARSTDLSDAIVLILWAVC